MKFDKLVESILNNDPLYLVNLLKTDSDFYHFFIKKKISLAMGSFEDIKKYVDDHYQYNEEQLIKLKELWDKERKIEQSAQTAY